MSRVFSSANRLNRTGLIVAAKPMTFAAWVYPTTNNNNNGIVCQDTVTGNEGGWGLYTQNTGILFAEESNGTTTASAATVATLSVNTWYHVAGVFSTITSRSVYLNGANKVTNATSVNGANATNTLIGCFYRNSTLCDFTGNVAGVGIWNIVLSDADVASLAAGACPLQVRPDALKSYVPLVSAASPEPDLISGSYPLVNTSSSVLNPPMCLWL